jgi:hypothetical protein
MDVEWWDQVLEHQNQQHLGPLATKPSSSA